jgi:capsular polysaccharide biosynthesis protein
MPEPALPGTESQSQLAAAFRRSWLVILVCVIVGVAVMGILHSARKAQYTSSSDVYIAEQDLSSLVLGVGISDDPNRDIANDLQLAQSINYQAAVGKDFGHGYDQKTVESHLDVTNDGEDDVLKFTTTAPNGPDAVRLANVAVSVYSGYRASVLSQPIISALEAGGASVSSTKKLNLLKKLNENTVIISRAQTATPQATLSKDLAIGLIAGLVVGLLIMALREAVPRLSPVQASTAPGGSRPLRVDPDPQSDFGTEALPPPVRVRDVADRAVVESGLTAATRLRRRVARAQEGTGPRPSAAAQDVAPESEPNGERTRRRGVRLPEPEVRPSTRGRNGAGNGRSSSSPPPPDDGDPSSPSGRRGR